MASITLKNISKSFADNQVIKNVDLEINDGEFIVFVGPSGCGKSTLLRIISGLEDLNEGNIFIDNDNVTDKIPYDRALSMVFQSYALYPHMNVFENIGFSLKTSGIKKDILSKKVVEIAKILRLEDLLNRLPKQLSGGQKQRVALARALILKPKVLLLDEPLSALDKKLREQMQSELRHLQKAVGITFILVTHDQEEALTMSDKVAVMFDGKVEQVASPRDLYERPSTQRVASFIGAMNFIECKVLEKGKNLKIRDSVLGSFDLSKEQVSGVSSNNSITIGIRPEMISILPKGSKIKNSISGKVSDISYFGETTYYKIKCDIDSKIFNISAQNSFGNVDYSIGEKIEFKIDLKSIVGFLK